MDASCSADGRLPPPSCAADALHRFVILFTNSCQCKVEGCSPRYLHQDDTLTAAADGVMTSRNALQSPGKVPNYQRLTLLVLVHGRTGNMQGFMKDEGCAALLAWGDDARSLVAAKAGAVCSARLRRRVLDLCYGGISVTNQVPLFVRRTFQGLC